MSMIFAYSIGVIKVLILFILNLTSTAVFAQDISPFMLFQSGYYQPDDNQGCQRIYIKRNTEAKTLEWRNLCWGGWDIEKNPDLIFSCKSSDTTTTCNAKNKDYKFTITLNGTSQLHWHREERGLFHKEKFSNSYSLVAKSGQFPYKVEKTEVDQDCNNLSSLVKEGIYSSVQLPRTAFLVLKKKYSRCESNLMITRLSLNGGYLDHQNEYSCRNSLTCSFETEFGSIWRMEFSNSAENTFLLNILDSHKKSGDIQGLYILDQELD